MQRFYPIVLLVVLSACAEKHRPEGTPGATAPRRWQKLLAEATAAGDGRVDYDLIAARRRVLDDYMAYLGEHGPLTDSYPYSKEDRSISFLANAYNAAVIYGVLEHWPLDSVRDVQQGLYRYPPGVGFFKGQQFYIDGQWLDLHTLEHQYLLGQFEDPYIHVMLNCASVGCPPVRVWDERKLDQQAEEALAAYLASPQGLRPSSSGDGYAISELFVWFDDQLVDWSSAGSVCQFLAPHAEGAAQEWLEAEHGRGCHPETFAYDWGLNARAGD